MEIYFSYKGVGIRYYQLTGTTCVEGLFYPIYSFIGYGEIDGRERAKKYIDEIMED